MIGDNYISTYEKIRNIITERNDISVVEYELPSWILFKNYEELFDVMQLCLDDRPHEYQQEKDEVINYFKNNIKDNRFSNLQKVIQIRK